MPVLRFPQSFTIGALAAALIASPASAQDGRAPEKQKPKPTAEKPVAETAAGSDASRYCAAVAPSIAEARIAWQTKRLTELEAQVKQRIADLEKAEASARDWIAKREATMSAANDDLVAIFAKMEPEAAARQLTAMDDKIAAAILGKLKPNAAGSILAEMEPEVASRLVGMLSPANRRTEEVVDAGFALAPLLAALALTGCWNTPDEFMREPIFSPVGAGLVSDETAAIQNNTRGLTPRQSSAASEPSLYTPPRVTHVGDIVTVLISINDKATLGNSSDRSQTTKDGVTINYGFNNGSSSSSSNQPASILGNLSSSSATQGQGNIDRSEQIQVSVAAVVTRVLPNGNLVISGSQEVRVNYELRQLSVAGIVNPNDISLNNTIAYDHIAEARISYGGRGRQSDVQQPSWGQQVYDALKPF